VPEREWGAGFGDGKRKKGLEKGGVGLELRGKDGVARGWRTGPLTEKGGVDLPMRMRAFRIPSDQWKARLAGYEDTPAVRPDVAMLPAGDMVLPGGIWNGGDVHIGLPNQGGD